MQGDFFFDADEMHQGLSQAEHVHLDAMVDRLQLGALPTYDAQNNGAELPCDSELPKSASKGDA